MANELVTLERDFNALAPQFEEVLAGIMKPERLIRTVLVSFERTPSLIECSRQSILNSAMSAAVLGLEVDGYTGQAFLIPFREKGTPKAQLVIGYKGFNTLGARAGLTITGDVIREGDDFDFDKGTGHVSHRPSLDPLENRRIRGAWAKAGANGRPSIIEVMGISEINEIKRRSPGAKRDASPWNDPVIGFPAMAAKSVKRRLARSTPLSVYALGAALDEAVEERGSAAWIGKDRMLRIEGGVAEREPAAPPSVADLVERMSPEQVIASLETIAKTRGTGELTREWNSLPIGMIPVLKSHRERLAALAAKTDKGEAHE